MKATNDSPQQIVELQVAENADEDGTATGNTTSTSAPANYVEAQLIFCLAAKPGAF